MIVVMIFPTGMKSPTENPNDIVVNAKDEMSQDDTVSNLNDVMAALCVLRPAPCNTCVLQGNKNWAR